MLKTNVICLVLPIPFLILISDNAYASFMGGLALFEFLLIYIILEVALLFQSITYLIFAKFLFKQHLYYWHLLWSQIRAQFFSAFITISFSLLFIGIIERTYPISFYLISFLTAVLHIVFIYKFFKRDNINLSDKQISILFFISFIGFCLFAIPVLNLFGFFSYI